MYFYIRILVVFVVILAISGLVAGINYVRGCTSANFEANLTREVKATPPSFSISAPAIVKEYLENESAAAAKYAGEVGIVTGTVPDSTEVRPLLNSGDHEWINLEANKPWVVRCFLSDEETGNLYELFRQRTHSFKGKVDGINNRRFTIDIRGCISQGVP